MKKLNYLAGASAIAALCSAASASAADINVTEAYFRQDGEAVHTLSNGSLDCVIKASVANSDAVMITAVYETGTDKLIGMSLSNASSGEFRSTVNITDAAKTYVGMYVWDGIETANAKTQVYYIAASDPAPENPWNVKLDNKGGVSFTWGACEDNLKTAGYRIYKNGEKIGETEKTSFADEGAKWYDSAAAEYKLTAYDTYGNESDGTALPDVQIDNSDIAAVLFAQPNITEKMSLYIATGKDSDTSWYGYNTAYEIDGVECRNIPADRRAVFKLSEDFTSRIGTGGREAAIRITYYDNGDDYVRVSYVGTNSRYTDLEIKKNGTNTWITKEFNVKDYAPAYYDPATKTERVQDESVDFSIWSKGASDKGDIVDTATYISEVVIVLKGESGEPSTEAPTLEPGATATPEPTATPDPTPEPTIDPSTITSADIKLLSGGTAAGSYESEDKLMSVFWGKNDGQINNTGWYAYNTGDTIDGEECRAIADNKRLVLMYNGSLDAAIGEGPRAATIRIRYYDSGSDKIRVSYISKASRYTTVTIQKNGTNTWKWAEIPVTDLANRCTTQVNSDGVGLQDESTYLSIWSRASGENETNNTTDYISEIQLVLSADASEPELPTAKPTEQPDATEEPGPTNEPEPTEPPEPLTGASISFLSGQTAENSYTSEHIRIFWGGSNQHTNNTGWYAYNTGDTIDGEECRYIPDNKRLVLMFDEALNEAIGSEPRSAAIRIRYYDSGTDKIRVSYISKASRYTTVTIQKENTGEWKWAEIKVDDLANISEQNANGVYLQDENTYFSIWSRASGETAETNTPDYISEVELVLE